MNIRMGKIYRHNPSAAMVVFILAALLVPLGKPHIALAADQTILDFHQVDLDKDGRPDEAIIDCACVTAHDQIRVYDGANDMQSSTDWQKGTDIEQDYWVFDIGRKGKANLIIRFLTTNDTQIARLYDDVTGDGVVAYHVDGKRIIIDESPFWSLEVGAVPRWFTENGQINLNIWAFLDKPVPAGFEFVDDKIARQYMPHDGHPDVGYRMVGSNQNNSAEYFLARLFANVPQRYEIGKSRLEVNVEKKHSKKAENSLFWPFLDLKQLFNANQASTRFFDLLPTVSIDWNSSSIRGFVLPGYALEAGYMVNSQSFIKDRQVNDSSYESPHAWYDLAGDQDGIPELNIRFYQPIGQPHEEIRFSWNQMNTNSLVWDYKLGMVGDNPIDEIVDLQYFSLRMIQYDKFPYWVTDHAWDLTTFVAREGKPRVSAEGIYAWSPWSGADPTSPNNPSVEANNAALSYVSGTDTVPPYQFFNDIWEGFRGEYNFTHPQQAVLYFSPIDHRLHLKGAEHGLLNLGNSKYVIYDNKNGDDYLDQWETIEAGKLRRQLYIAKDHLIYSGENEVILKQTSPANSIFTTLPPRNHTEWIELGKKLKAYQRDIAPDNFKEMVLQMDGPEMRIEGGTVEDYRTTQDGFRFTLMLQPGFKIQGSNVHNWNNLSPGLYVVTYNHSISIVPNKPPALSVSLIDAKLTHLKSGVIHIALRNDGLEDLPQATLELWATPPGGKTIVAATEAVQLFAQEPSQASLFWTPTSAGQWTLKPVIRQADGRVVEGKSVQVHVLEAPVAEFSDLLPLSVSGKFIPFIVPGLLLFAVISSMTFFEAWKRSHH